MTRLLLIRPVRQSNRFAKQLAESGWQGETVVSPVLTIKSCAVKDQIDPSVDMVFTSENAVQAISQLGPFNNVIAWCVGETTAKAASNLGFIVRNANGDAHKLENLILAERPRQLQFIRGRTVSYDLKKSLNLAGIETNSVVAYDQIAANLSAESQDMIKGDQRVILPLFSVRSAELFFQQVSEPFRLHTIALSEQIAQVVPTDAVTQCDVTKKPNGTSMIAAIKSLDVT